MLARFPRGKLSYKNAGLDAASAKSFTQCSVAEIPIELLEQRKEPGWQKFASGNRLFSNGRRKGYANRDALRLAVSDNPALNVLADLLGVRYSRVVSVEPSLRASDVYGLSVESGSFLCNGYIVGAGAAFVR